MTYLDRRPDQPPLWPVYDAYLRFVLKLHRASSLHYDLRLETWGQLLSWVLVQPPSFDPACEQVAIHVPNHRLSGLLAERRIPNGQYGAGPMLVVDCGTFAPYPYHDGSHEKTLREQCEQGLLKVQLYGTRLKGIWKIRQATRDWLFQKEHDEFAYFNPFSWDERSILTGRCLDEI